LFLLARKTHGTNSKFLWENAKKSSKRRLRLELLIAVGTIVTMGIYESAASTKTDT